MRRIILLLAVMGVMVSVSAGAAMAQATTETVSFTEPSAAEVIDPCTGEGTILVEGRTHFLFHVTYDDNGGFHAVGNITTEMVGENLTTGTKYVMGSRRQETDNFLLFGETNETSESTYTSQGEFISQGPGDNFLFTSVYHITMNANGEITAEVFRVEAECRG